MWLQMCNIFVALWRLSNIDHDKNVLIYGMSKVSTVDKDAPDLILKESPI